MLVRIPYTANNNNNKL